MGQDLRILFERTAASTSIRDMPAILNATTAAIQPAAARLGLKLEPWSAYWQWKGSCDEERWGDDFANSSCLFLEGPFSLHLDVTPHCLLLGLWVRWRAFLEWQDVRHQSCEIASIINSVLHSSAILYLPDNACEAADKIFNAVDEGASLPQLLGSHQFPLQEYRAIFPAEKIWGKQEYLLLDK